MENNRANTLYKICTLLVFLIPFDLHYRYLLNSFYHFGAPFNDTGIFALLSWHGDWKLNPPMVFTNNSFFGVHCCLILIILNELSYLIPSGMAEHYSTFLAAVYSSIGLALFYAFTACTDSWKNWHIVVIAIISALFCFNNAIMNGIWIGHIEYAIPLGIFLFLLFFIQNKPRASIAAFIFILMIREDAGLHLTAVLGLLAMLRLYEKRSFKAIKRELCFIFIAVIYSILAMFLIFAVRHFHGSIFEAIYSGSPPYAHVTWQLLLDRIKIIGLRHVDIWFGFLATLVMAIYMRSLYMIIGYIAYIPWFILNWTAINNNTGILYAYYSYPFILSLMWPVIGAAWKYGWPLNPKVARQVLLLQIILVFSSIIFLNYGDHTPEFGPIYNSQWGSYKTEEGLKNKKLVLKFFDGISQGEGNYGAIMADQSSLTMVRYGQYKGQDLIRLETDKPADSIIAMLPDRNKIPDNVASQVKKNHLPYKYCVSGTTICIFTNRTAEQLK